MAFSKQPVNSTYQTKPLMLWNELNSRGMTIGKDEFCLNVYPEPVSHKLTQDKILNIIKRAGSYERIASVGSDVRGAFVWKDQQKLFVCVGTTVYVYNSNSGTIITTLLSVVGAGTGHVGFEEFLYSTGEVKLVVTDGTTLSTIDSSNVVVASADPDMPVHLPYPVVVDGYLFLLKAGTSDVYNSDNDDPLAWTSGDFITAEMRPDTSRMIARLNNYIVVFGSKSIEYFYDAANESGSPLSRNDSPIKSIGYVGGFAQFGNKIYFVGEESESQPNVFVLEDFKATPLENAAIRRHLSSVVTDSYTNLIGSIVAFNGHDFYTLYTTTYTYVLELDSKLWGLWAYQALASFPIKFSFQNYGVSGYQNLFILNTSAAVYAFNDSLGQDSGVAFSSAIVTANEDFDSYNNKFANRLIIYGDQQDSSQLVSVQTSDNDYKTWTTARTVDMTQERPSMDRMGRFRRRAHKLTYTGSLPWRVNKIDLELNLGN